MSFRGLITRVLLRLPDRALVRLSGGEPITINGKTLDARLQFLHHAAKSRPGLHELGVEAARAGIDRFMASIAAAPEPGVQWEDIRLKSDGRTVGARLYRPAEQDAEVPMLVYYHMGGGVIMGPETVHAFCSLLSARAKGPVLSVDYRLAPEHKFPAGLEDAIAAYEWALTHGENYGAAPGRAAVGGDSMGGLFATVVCQEMKRDDKPQPVLQLLIYPATDMSEPMPSRKTYGHIQHLPTEVMEWFSQLYLPEGTPLDNPRVSPAQTQDLDGLAPAHIYTAGFDAIRDHGTRYAQQLKGEMVRVRQKTFETLAHGFTAHMGICPAARTACEQIADETAAALRKRRQGGGSAEKV